MNDPNQVAAATLAMPPFVMLTGIANLLGIGGASLISRSLGVGDQEKAKKCAAFSVWTAAVIALIYGATMYLIRPVVFPLLGTDANTYGYCSDYVLWTITVGGIPTVLNACLAHLVRAEGYSKEASFGVAFGGILNIILDPVLIFSLKLGVTGAAIATMLSNTVLNKIVVSYSNQAIAGMGIAKKIDMLAFAIANGMTQGVLPLIGYNYAAKKYPRMCSAIRNAFIYSVAVASAGALLLFTCAVPVVRGFIDDAETVAYGQHFLRIICISCPAVSVTMMIISIFQATGQKTKPMILSLLRKGGLDVPFMFLMNAAVGADGIPWATPIADCLAMVLALILFIPYRKRLQETMEEVPKST